MFVGTSDFTVVPLPSLPELPSPQHLAAPDWIAHPYPPEPPPVHVCVMWVTPDVSPTTCEGS